MGWATFWANFFSQTHLATLISTDHCSEDFLEKNEPTVFRFFQRTGSPFLVSGFKEPEVHFHSSLSPAGKKHIAII
jgi:hypothetical protein